MTMNGIRYDAKDIAQKADPFISEAGKKDDIFNGTVSVF